MVHSEVKMASDKFILYKFAPRYDNEVHELLRSIGGLNEDWVEYYDSMILLAIDHLYVVTNSQNKVIAVGGAKILDKESAQLCLLCVAEGYRGRGIGRSIYKKLLSILPDSIKMLQVISDTKLEELQVWKHWGFEETGVHDDGYGNDEIILTKYKE